MTPSSLIVLTLLLSSGPAEGGETATPPEGGETAPAEESAPAPAPAPTPTEDAAPEEAAAPEEEAPAEDGAPVETGEVDEGEAAEVWAAWLRAQLWAQDGDLSAGAAQAGGVGYDLAPAEALAAALRAQSLAQDDALAAAAARAAGLESDLSAAEALAAALRTQLAEQGDDLAAERDAANALTTSLSETNSALSTALDRETVLQSSLQATEADLAIEQAALALRQAEMAFHRLSISPRLQEARNRTVVSTKRGSFVQTVVHSYRKLGLANIFRQLSPHWMVVNGVAVEEDHSIATAQPTYKFSHLLVVALLDKHRRFNIDCTAVVLQHLVNAIY